MSRRLEKSLLIMVVFIGLAQVAYPAFEEKPSSTRALGMGGAFIGVADDAYSIYLNPAGLARLCRVEIGTTHTTLFGLEELKYSNLAYAQPLGRFGGLGLGWEGFGEGIYQEREVILSYAKRFFKGTHLGGSLKYMELSIETVGRGVDLGLDLGLLQEFGKRVRVGCLLQNVNRPRIGEDLPLNIAAGISIEPIERIILAADFKVVQISTKEPLSYLALGTEFEFNRSLLLRCGFQNEPQRVNFGLGLRKGWVGFDYAYSTHNLLGQSHQVGLILVISNW